MEELKRKYKDNDFFMNICERMRIWWWWLYSKLFKFYRSYICQQDLPTSISPRVWSNTPTPSSSPAPARSKSRYMWFYAGSETQPSELDKYIHRGYSQFDPSSQIIHHWKTATLVRNIVIKDPICISDSRNQARCTWSSGEVGQEIAAEAGEGNWNMSYSGGTLQSVFWRTHQADNYQLCGKGVASGAGQGLNSISTSIFTKTIQSYQTLYESSIAFGMRQALQA